MSNTLLPCPFCGGKARWMYLKPIGWVMCKKCGASSAELSDNYEEADCQQEAIAAWNRRADARQLALKTGVCPMCEDCPDGCPVETPNDSRNKPENEPLTQDELKQMEGEPVWIVTLDGTDEPRWEIVVSAGKCGVDLICVLNGFETRDYADFDLYNDTWLAYRNKPVKEEHHEAD